MKQRDLHETIVFQRSRTLKGNIRPVTVGRRNGKTAALFGPEWISLEPMTDAQCEDRRTLEIREELCVNLNPIERRTWEQIINGRSIREIAAEEKVKRPAI